MQGYKRQGYKRQRYKSFLLLTLTLILTLTNTSLLAQSKNKTKSQTPAPAPAQAPAPVPLSDGKLSATDIKNLQEQLKLGEYLTVDFAQTVYKSLRKKTTTSSGSASFIKPDKFRWQLVNPKKEDWLYDGKNLIHFDSERKEALRYQGGASKGKELRSLVDMVLSFDTLMSRYKLIQAVRKNKTIELDFTPLQAEEMTSTHLVVNTEKNFIQEVKLVFKTDNTTTFSFSNPRKDKLDTNKLFALPSNVKIIEGL